MPATNAKDSESSMGLQKGASTSMPKRAPAGSATPVASRIEQGLALFAGRAVNRHRNRNAFGYVVYYYCKRNGHAEPYVPGATYENSQTFGKIVNCI